MTQDEKEHIKRRALKEFSQFSIGEMDDFCGGRFQTTVRYVFAHLGQDGIVKKIEINKPGGTIFYLKV